MATVLVVDDARATRLSLEAVLEHDGHEVIACDDAESSIEFLQPGSRGVDVVLSDIVLPRMSGVELLSTIRRNLPNVQVILMTGEPDIESAAEGLREGAFDHLTKPVKRDAVCRAVRNAAEKKALLDREAQLLDENRRHQEQLEEMLAARNKELVMSERRFRLLADNSVDVVWQMSLGLRFTYISPSLTQLTGHTPEEWIGTRLREHATRDEYRKMAREALRAVRGYRRFQLTRIEANMLRKDGSNIPVEIVGKLLLNDAGLPVGLQGSTRDITERREADRRIRSLLNQQTLVNSLALRLGSEFELDVIYREAHQAVRGVMDADSFIVSEYERGAQLIHARYVVFSGERFDTDQLPSIPLEEEGRGTQSHVIRSGQPLLLDDYRAAREGGRTEYSVDDDGNVSEGPPPESETATRSALLVPLVSGGETVGVMQVQSYRRNAYAQEDETLLMGLASVTAIAITNASLVAKLERSVDSVVELAGNTVETRDPYTAGHQRRVAQLSDAIALQLGLSAVERKNLSIAALLHDLGKLAIPAEILSKPRRLTDMEFSLIQQHPAVAARLLETVEFPGPVAELIHQHHERLDGSGYPRGLSEEEILPGARILAVSDVVEAMASHRPYRPALGVQAALDEIEARRGELYDAEVVDACLHIFRSGEFEFGGWEGVSGAGGGR